MDHQGSFLNSSNNKISASKDEMKTSLLSQLDYVSSGSETHSSVPSSQSGGPPNNIVGNFSLPPDIEMDAFSVIPTTGPGPSSQGDILDNSFVEWIPDVNCMLPSSPDSVPQLEPDSIQPTFSVDPFQNTTAYHLDNVSNTQNQSNFAVDATLPTSSFLPSMIDTGHHDQFASSVYPTSDVPSSSSLEARPFSFTNNLFLASDLYADLVNINPIYGNALDAEILLQADLSVAHMDLDPPQRPAFFDQPELVLTQSNFVQQVSDVNIPKASFFGNAEQLENPMSMHSMPGQADALRSQAKDPGNTNSDAQTEHQYQIPELLKALEASRKEVDTLRNELYSVSKKYKNLKKSCDELREFRRTHRTTAEQHDNEIKVYKEQIEASILDRKEQSRTIDKLIVNLRNLEEKNERDKKRIKLDEERIKQGEERIKQDEERIQRDGERLKRDKEKFRRDEESRQILLKEAIEDHKKKMTDGFKKQQNDIKAVLDRINSRYKNIIPASLSSNHGDPKTFRSSTHVNTTRESLINRHQARFSNGNFPN